MKKKNDKRIFLPINPFGIKTKINIPIFLDNKIKYEYLFIDKNILEQIRIITNIFYEVSSHMVQFQSMHIRDFFVKYELNKPSKGAIVKQEIYDNYFYKNIENRKVNELFNGIVNETILFNNFISYLRELCGTFVNELKERFDIIEYIRLHFRKYYKTENENILYIAFCQATSEKLSPPIRDIGYDDSIIKIAFENNVSIVYNHNKTHNPLSMSNSIYRNFITIAPNISKNSYEYRNHKKDILRPYLSASLSITFKEASNFLDILNYLDIGDFIFKLAYDYASLFKIDMDKFILYTEEV